MTEPDRPEPPAPAPEPAPPAGPAPVPTVSPGLGAEVPAGGPGTPLEEWVLRERLPLAVLALCFLLLSAQAAWHHRARAPAPPAAAATRTPSAHATKAPPERPVSAKGYSLVAPVLLVISQGLLILLGLGLAWTVSPRCREWLALGHLTERRFPAVNWLDLLVALAVMVTFPPLFLLLLRFLGRGGAAVGWPAPDSGGLPTVTAILANFASYVVVVVVVVCSARRREGPSGAEGLWPFWKPSVPGEDRDLWGDVRSGLVFFLLFSGVLVLLNLANAYCIPKLGLEPDMNPVLGPVESEKRLGVLLPLVTLISLGPAVFEELLFRGILYNVLRCHMSRLLAAVLASLVFSWMHGVVSNVLSLFVLGLLLTWLYERTGRLLPAMVFHAVNNSVAMYIAKVLTT